MVGCTAASPLGLDALNRDIRSTLKYKTSIDAVKNIIGRGVRRILQEERATLPTGMLIML